MGVFKKNDQWWIDFYDQGRRRRQKIGTRKKEAEDALSKIKGKIAAGEFVPIEEREAGEGERPRLSFADFAVRQFLPWSQAEHSANHNQRLRSIVKAHLIPCFGQRQLAAVTPRRLGSPFVFCNRWGKPYDNVRKALNRAATEAGIDGGVTLHQLRHAFCSRALMQGIDPRTVQKWMGHQDLKTTLKYSHASPDHERSAIQRLRYQDGHHMDTKRVVQRNQPLTLPLVSG